MESNSVKSKKITVIIPAYNAENTITKCLDSLYSQTVKPARIIIIDDGSKDLTGEICDQFCDKHTEVTVIHQENCGVSSARNRGIALCETEYLTFVDSDDYLGAKYIETLLMNLGSDFVTCGFHLQNPELKWENIQFVDEYVTIDKVRAHPSIYMGKYYFGNSWAKVYKKSIIDQWTLKYDPLISNGEDTLFIFNYLEHCEDVRIVPISDYFYTFQKKSLSHKVHPDYWKWRTEQEKAIRKFFYCKEPYELRAQMDREFWVMKELLHIYYKDWNYKQIQRLYSAKLFQRSISYKRKVGTSEDKCIIFLLDHNVYKLYEYYKSVQWFFIRAKRHVQRKLYLQD